ncbi:MAG: MarR family winged helix-turn-helix transcriptional regulator [Candidatus Methanomethylicaceae archaeon]
MAIGPTPIYYILNALYRGQGMSTALTVGDIALTIGWRPGYTRDVLEEMYKMGLVMTIPEKPEYLEGKEITILWTLTDKGKELAEKVFRNVKEWRRIITEELKL